MRLGGLADDWSAYPLARLRRAELDSFNGGDDLPDVDTILVLRSTESQILWLQQFGRGLRFRPEKRLEVIDYVGNHRAFLLEGERPDRSRHRQRAGPPFRAFRGCRRWLEPCS